MLGLSDDVLVIPAKQPRITWVVRVVRLGDKYGSNWCLTHDKAELMAEFYDSRYTHSSWGQFVSRYYLSSLLGRCKWSPKVVPGQGLDLMGGANEWKIDGETMDEIRAWLKTREEV